MQRAETKTGKRPFMLIDVSLCIGCHACVNACKFENGLSIKQFNTWIETWDAGDYPQVVRANVPHLCNHCDNAPCLAVCPTGATYRNDDGLILVDQDRCIGCKYCMAACPYGVRWQNEAGEVEKCTFCVNRTSQGLLPACAGNCPTHARLFGDLNDPNSEVAQKVAKVQVESMLPELGIETNTCYVGLAETNALPKSSSVLHGGRVAVKLQDLEGGE